VPEKTEGNGPSIQTAQLSSSAVAPLAEASAAAGVAVDEEETVVEGVEVDEEAGAVVAAGAGATNEAEGTMEAGAAAIDAAPDEGAGRESEMGTEDWAGVIMF